MQAPAGGSHLSSRLAELAAQPLRSQSSSIQAEALDLAPEGPGSLLRQGKRVLVYVRFDRGAAASSAALRAAGGEIVDVSRRYQTVTVAAKPARLEQLGRVPGVAGITEALAPFTAAPVCPSGEVVSEGDQQLNAAKAREELLVDGSGVKVGILSDSFDQATEAADGSGPIATHALEDEESGDLPGPAASPCTNQSPVEVLDEEEELEGEGPSDEGRAMVQIVHDLAPGASIDFASAFNGETAFAANIGELAEAEADVIADDVFYLEEPFFQDGPIAVAVREAVEGGATYLSAAGNNNLFDPEGHEIASWEAPKYRDAGGCPPAVQVVPGARGTHCLDFNPGARTDRTFGIKVEPGATLTVDLQWDEPWHGVGVDLDAFLLNANGNLIASSEEDNVGISQQPLEVLQWVNETASLRTVQVVVNRFSGGGDPRLKLGLVENGSGVAATEYPRSTGEDVVGPTIFGHAGTAEAISVGAVRFDAVDPSLEPEEYSSRGPVRHDFEPVEGLAPAAEFTVPEELSKPDVAATDCGVTTFFAFLTGAGWRFCGTSAAAPHAAAVAALMLDAEPAATPAEIRTGLQASAEGALGFDPCAVGAGLVEAVGAIEALPSPPPFVPAECLPPSPEGSVDEAQAPGNWGLEAPPSSGGGVFPQPLDIPPTESEPRRIAPQTFIRQRPPKLVRTRSRKAKVVFRFGANEVGVSFACRIDGGLFRPCPERLVRRFAIGWHSVRVVARNASGEGDRTPAAYRFRVKHVG